MKQHITLDQWDEISKKAKSDLWEAGFQYDWRMNIGQMIEFLGDDLVQMEKCNHWQIRCNYRLENSIPTYDGSSGEELCDALWEAVKEKLNHSDS